jgi:hypothetical protein
MPVLPSGWKWYIHEDSFHTFLETWENAINKANTDNPIHKGKNNSHGAIEYFNFALYTHFEISNNFGRVQDLLHKTIQHANDYFWGSWRHSYERYPGEIYHEQECRHNLSWIREYRSALLATLLLDDKDNIRSISRWAGDGIGIYGEYEFT